MKNIHKVTTTLLIAVMFLSAFPITAVAAKPQPSPQPPAISITANPAGPLQITVGEQKAITITSTYSKPLNWAVSTTLGTASINPNQTMIFEGSQSTTLTVSSGTAGSGKVSITATDSTNRKIKSTMTVSLEFVPISEPLNSPPVFTGNNYTINTNEDVSGSVIITATDPDGNTLTYANTPPSNGIVSKTDASYIYKPEPNFYGADSFSVTASDGKVSTTVTVGITVNSVNDAPVAVNDTASGNVGDTVRVYVLANDSDIDSDLLSIASFTPVAGAVVSQGDKYFDITATTAGEYTFSYLAYDGSVESNPATVTVTFSQDLIYVALGDSIPYGYYSTSLWDYLTGGTDGYSYIEQYRDAMGVLPANYYDESVSGYNSIDVLNQLSNSSIVSMIIDADVITICVGGNDIMDAAPRTITGLDKYNVNWTVADQGRDAFEANWNRIIDGIEELNPDVTLIVMTVYNPYRSTDSNYTKADSYFEDTTDELNYGLNYIIRNTETLYDEQLSDDFDYRVVDVYSAFNASANKDSLTGFYNSFCDPHPNQNGHNLIFAEHYKVFN